VERGDRYQEAVASVFPLGTRVTVEVRNHQGKAVLDFKGIPVGQESKLVAVLTGELPPVREVRLVEKEAPLA
jgi:3D (Asp-Asp-Asp) domain-containing protein